jgi:hypothetical protein
MPEDAKGNQIKVGAWYLRAICASCQHPIPIFEIEKNAPIEPGNFSFRDVPCPHCKARHDYRLDATQRLQAQPEEPPR